MKEMTDKEFEKLLDEVAGERAENVTMHADPRYTETVMEKTINGGDYSVAYYYDSNGNPCKKSEATAVNIVEYSKDGERINECYGVLKCPDNFRARAADRQRACLLIKQPSFNKPDRLDNGCRHCSVRCSGVRYAGAVRLVCKDVSFSGENARKICKA